MRDARVPFCLFGDLCEITADKRLVGQTIPADPGVGPFWMLCSTASTEDVPPVVELGDGDPVSELSQAGEAATSGAAVVLGL